MPHAFWRHLTSHLGDSLSLDNYFTARKKKIAGGFQLVKFIGVHEHVSWSVELP